MAPSPNGTGTSSPFASAPTIDINQIPRKRHESPPNRPRSTTVDAPSVPDRSLPQSTTGSPVLNLRSESDRRKTFTNWPDAVSFIDPNRLAAAGFYYLNKADLVRCIFCGIEIGKWEQGDDPMRDHQRWKPNCPFLKNQNVGNVPFGWEEAASASTSSAAQGYDTCGPYGIEVRPFSGPERGLNHSLEKLGIHKSTGPMYKDYSSYDARLRSYTLWPVSLKQKPNVLSDAGFYYTGKGDQTVCFHCGGGLKDWEDSDDPWVEHALWFSKCMFVLLVKGKAFVDQVCAEKQAKLTSKETQELGSLSPSTSTSTEQTAAEPGAVQAAGSCKPITVEPISMEAEESNKNGKSDEARLCKICFTEELGVLFLPCGHIVACVHCAPALSVCAVCRQPFTATVRAYLP